jgi:YfiH family protein
MEVNQHKGIRYYTSDIFPSSLVHGIFTRLGGASPAPWASLNVGGTVGDDPQRVIENRNRTLETLGLSFESVFDVWQVHGTNVAFADKPRQPDSPYQQADIILTDRPGVSLLMRFADCVPLLLFDPAKGVVGLAHAGWMGTVRGVATVAVEAMCNLYGSKPQDLQVLIGPSIGPDHYVVGPDVVINVLQAFGTDADELMKSVNGRVYLDLWSANRLQLERAGVGHISLSGICTACNVQEWFSHRGEKGRTGRFCALIALPN